MNHLLLVGAWPELASRLVGLPGRVTLLQLDGMPGGSDLTPYARWAADLIHAPWDQPAKVVKLAAELHARDPLDVVAGYGEFTLSAVTAIAQHCGIRSVPGPADQRPGKAAQRAMLAAGGCMPVRCLVCDGPDDVRRFAAGRPVILKPDLGNGSLGVFAVTDACRIDEGWRWVRAAGLGAVLAEEMLAGPEFSVETRSVEGRHEVLMVTEKFTSGPPHFVEVGHVMPARTAAGPSLEDEAVRALIALGHADGPAHVELILTEAGPAVVEVNRRLGGDRIWELLQLSTGIDVLRLVLLDALGKPPVVDRSVDAAAAIRFVHGDAAMFADGPPVQPTSVAAVPGLVRFRWEPTTYHRRLGHVLTHAADPSRAVHAAEQACASFPDRPPAGTVT
ncbi:biotin carboxylase [Kribbella antiqua]|uniref:Biotin carboxylase n=1 Tax=Kribbella antiqua TaxID=2512217 RepID=A0A4R2ID27_9ACTN|nr:ATP-grasp domain-containing protein [Kribbella antiqua]TCO40505.1 biotin carboxylase [Kribbella antiqua]